MTDYTGILVKNKHDLSNQNTKLKDAKMPFRAETGNNSLCDIKCLLLGISVSFRFSFCPASLLHSINVSLSLSHLLPSMLFLPHDHM